MRPLRLEKYTSVNIVWLLLLSKLKFVDPTCLCSVINSQNINCLNGHKKADKIG